MFFHKVRRALVLHSTNVGVLSEFRSTIAFLGKAALVGTCTGGGVVVFKMSLLFLGTLFYEDLANLLPRPAFYWPLALYPILGSVFVCILTAATGPAIRNGVDYIASSIDYVSEVVNGEASLESVMRNENRTDVDSNCSAITTYGVVPVRAQFSATSQLLRLAAAVCTVGSGCSLGPEGE